MQGRCPKIDTQSIYTLVLGCLQMGQMKRKNKCQKQISHTHHTNFAFPSDFALMIPVSYNKAHKATDAK